MEKSPETKNIDYIERMLRTEYLEQVLTNLCRTIEATGGLKRAKDGTVTLAADEEWLDLAMHYEDACKVLGRDPKVEDVEEETF